MRWELMLPCIVHLVISARWGETNVLYETGRCSGPVVKIHLR
jgi:hypothetical protein